MDKKAGTHLGKALVTITEDLKNMMEEDGTIASEVLHEFTRQVVVDMNEVLQKETNEIAQGTLNIILLALANYSVIEKRIFQAAGIEISPERKAILDKVYETMSKDL